MRRFISILLIIATIGSICIFSTPVSAENTLPKTIEITFDENTGIVNWNPVEGAKYYILNCYNDYQHNYLFYDKHTTSTNIDFYQYFGPDYLTRDHIWAGSGDKYQYDEYAPYYGIADFFGGTVEGWDDRNINLLNNEYTIHGTYSLYVYAVCEIVETEPVTGNQVTKGEKTCYGSKVIELNVSNEDLYPGYILNPVITINNDKVIYKWDDTRTKTQQQYKENFYFEYYINVFMDGKNYGFFNGKLNNETFHIEKTENNYVDLSELKAFLVKNNYQDKAAVTFKVHSTYDGFINSKEQGFVGNLFRYYGLAVISKFLYENGTYYYRFITARDELASNMYGIPTNHWGDFDTERYVYYYDISCGGTYTPDFNKYDYYLILASPKEMNNIRDDYRENGTFTCSYKEKIVTKDAKGKIDFTNLVVKGGTNAYHALVIAFSRKNPTTYDKYSLITEYENFRLYRQNESLYFTSNTPELESYIDVKKGDKYTITYSVSELPKWLKDMGMTLSSPYVHIQKPGDKRPANYVPTEVSPGKWSVEINTTGMTGEYKVWYDVYMKNGDDFYGDTLEGTFTLNVFDGYINLDELKVKVATPELGKHPDYTIKDFNGESEWYSLEVEWQEHVDNSGDGWKTISSDSVFRSGVTYRPKIKVIPKGDYRVKFKNAYINGEKENVSCSYLSENITAYYMQMMPEDTYYPIYVGMVQVGEGNRHDVLGDGGSVQYLLKGECNDKYLIDRDVLVLNNMNLGTLKYHGGAGVGEECAAIYTSDDLYIKLIGNNTIVNGFDHVNGISSSSDYLTFWGDGTLSVSVSNNERSAIYSDNVEIYLYDNVRLTLSGYRAINSYGLYLNDNSSIYAYGYRSDDDKDFPTICSSEITLADNSYLYAEHDWIAEAIDTWGSTFYAYVDTELTIKGIKNILGVVNQEWTNVEGLNEGSGKPHESEYRALSIQAGVAPTATSITLDKTSIEFDNENQSDTITATITPSTVIETITWTSSDDSVVSVEPNKDCKARIKALKDGTVTITAALSNGLKATCKVTVKLKVEEPPIEVESGKGDINIDTKVNAADCNLMKKIILGQYSTTEKQWWAADLNDDNKVNAADLSMLIKLIVK